MVDSGFFSIGEEDNELAVVIRSHLYIEHQLERFVRANLPNPDELGERLGYATYVRLALACGLRPDLKSSLNALGDLRNKFLRDLRTSLTDEEMEQFHALRGFRLKDGPQVAANFYDLTPQSPRRQMGEYLWLIARALEEEIENGIASSPQSD
jgi:hypothetical protein